MVTCTITPCRAAVRLNSGVRRHDRSRARSGSKKSPRSLGSTAVRNRRPAKRGCVSEPARALGKSVQQAFTAHRNHSLGVVLLWKCLGFCQVFLFCPAPPVQASYQVVLSVGFTLLSALGSACALCNHEQIWRLTIRSSRDRFAARLAC